MIHEYAVDPDSLFTPDGFWTILKDIGISKGRVIVECPSDGWTRLVEQALVRAFHEFGETKCTRLVELLRDVRIVEHGIRKRPGLRFDNTRAPWPEKLREENQREPFRAVLTNQAATDFGNLLTPSDIRLGDKRWEVSMQQIVPRDIESIAQCIGPLGRMSREFLLIDPYFDEEAKWENGLLAILRHSNAADLHFRRIEVHTKEYRCSERVRSKADALRDLKKTLALKLANGITVRIFIWKQRGEGERFHRRYVLSELGGIWFEGGLDKGKPGETTDVGILERDVWDKRWQQYQPETAAFELIGEPITIVGSRL